ncbi:hypothetical protein [Pseudoalteromonas luteoviolacea]|nr:hypothetical protein [Pseudoalteromonas luteoviolacea]
MSKKIKEDVYGHSVYVKQSESIGAAFVASLFFNIDQLHFDD